MKPTRKGGPPENFVLTEETLSFKLPDSLQLGGDSQQTIQVHWVDFS